MGLAVMLGLAEPMGQGPSFSVSFEKAKETLLSRVKMKT
jgi:hypothetical protein